MPRSSLDGLPDIWRETYDLVSQIPKGMVSTYGHVASALGDKVAARFVGLAMSRNDDVVRVPCRRVVYSDGRVGGYTSPRGADEKVELLRKEGVPVRNGRVQDLPRYLFTDFESSEPLKALRDEQRRLRSRVKLPADPIPVERLAGADIAYDGDTAYASIVVMDPSAGKTVDTLEARSDAPFPYIPTYLAYRELPVLRDIAGELDEGTVLMYDGNGVLHPERFGIASHAGVAFGTPTVGVAKKLLCGSLSKGSEGLREVEVDGLLAGYSISSEGRSPIYVSPGHGVSFEQALSLARSMLRHRLPEPVRLAHVAANYLRHSTSNK